MTTPYSRITELATEIVRAIEDAPEDELVKRAACDIASKTFEAAAQNRAITQVLVNAITSGGSE